MRNTLSVKLSIGYLIIIIMVALFASFLANPDNGIVTDYGPNSIGEKNNTFEAPGFIDTYKGTDRIHPLGTDGRGRDIAALMIHGSRTSLLLGLFASLISVVIGSTFGVMSGFYGNSSISMHPFSILLFIVGTVLIFFFANEFSYSSVEGVLSYNLNLYIGILLVSLLLLFATSRKIDQFLRSKSYVPVDSIVMRMTEIFRAVPKLFILLTLIAFIRKPSVWTTALLLGCLGWSRILRLVRGEVIEIKTKSFITNATLLGLSDLKVIISHVIPNILPIILVSMAFLISNNILLESTLSFLGLGIPLDVPSWGGILRQSREDFSAWWLAIFPGLTITLTLFSLNILAEHYNKSMQ